MTEPLNRDEIIALLERLGRGDDADVLAAARALHAAVTNAGTAWAELLVPEDSGDTAAVDTGVADLDTGVADLDTGAADVDTGADDLDTAAADVDTGAGEPAEAEAEIPAGKAGRDAESLALIVKLLARSGVSEAFRQEM